MSRDGVPLGTGLLLSRYGNTSGHQIVSDGHLGALVAWGEDHGIYVQRIGESGSILWTDGGVRVTSDTARVEAGPLVAADGQGGALVAWVETRYDFDTTLARVYVQRIAANGRPVWIAGGHPAAETHWEMRNPALTGGGDGGAIVVWEDLREGDSDIYAQRLDPFWGGFSWPGGYDQEPEWEGVPVASVRGSVQAKPQIVSDGTGGCCVVWEDNRNGNTDLYAQRMTSYGDQAWVSGGRAVTSAPGAQQDFTMDSDGGGGVVVAWRDFRNSGDVDVFGQRVDVAGRVLWDADGVAMCRAVGEPTSLHAVTDGSGGLIASWMDTRLGALDVWAQRVSAEGAVRWAPDGAAVSLAAGDQFNASLTTDGRGGAIVVWDDARSDYSREIFGQRIDRSGDLGDPAPTIASVLDVPLDQGGKVKVSWHASYLAADAVYPIASYWVWRSVPESEALVLVRHGAVLIEGEEATALGREGSHVILRATVSGEPVFWELFGTQVASADSGYSMLVPTTSDSMPEGNPLTFFRVQARHRDGATFWTSPTASGFSRDNLAPPSVDGLFATLAGDALRLHWKPSTVSDFSAFRIYRGATQDFVPGPDSMISTQSDTGYTAPLASSFYKLSAVDVHGNESPYATLVTSTVLAVADQPAAAFGIVAAPNPVRDRLLLRFVLPHSSEIRVTVFDVNGRAIRELARGLYASGPHALAWEGEGKDGRPVSSGRYYVRLDAEQSQLTRGIVIRR